MLGTRAGRPLEAELRDPSFSQHPAKRGLGGETTGEAEQANCGCDRQFEATWLGAASIATSTRNSPTTVRRPLPRLLSPPLTAAATSDWKTGFNWTGVRVSVG